MQNKHVPSYKNSPRPGIHISIDVEDHVQTKKGFLKKIWDLIKRRIFNCLPT